MPCSRLCRLVDLPDQLGPSRASDTLCGFWHTLRGKARANSGPAHILLHLASCHIVISASLQEGFIVVAGGERADNTTDVARQLAQPWVEVYNPNDDW
jgi:hypothetical protein